MSKGDAEKQDADWMMNTDNEIEHQEGTNHQGNCSKGCPYGKNRPFCFPCYKKLMKVVPQKEERWSLIISTKISICSFPFTGFRKSFSQI